MVGTSNPAPALPDLRRRHGLRHHGRARPRWQPNTSGGPGARCWPTWSSARWTARGSSARVSTSSPACRGSRSTPTRCTSCRVGRRRRWSTSTTTQCRSLALVLRDVVRRYDALVGLPPAVRAGGAPGARRRPSALPLPPGAAPAAARRPGIRKYLAGPEVGGGSMTNESDPDEKASGAPCRPRLRRPAGCSARSATTCATSSSALAGMDMAAVAGETVADTIYAIDRVADDALLDWFEEHWPGVMVVSEGLDEPVVVGAAAAWTVIVDTHRRHARADVRQAPGLVPGRRCAAGRRSGGHRRGGHDRTADDQAGRCRPVERHARWRPAGRARRPRAAGSAMALERAAVGGNRPRAQLQRAGQVLPAGQAGTGRARSRAVPRGSACATSSTTSTSRPAGSSTS